MVTKAQVNVELKKVVEGDELIRSRIVTAKKEISELISDRKTSALSTDLAIRIFALSLLLNLSANFITETIKALPEEYGISLQAVIALTTAWAILSTYQFAKKNFIDPYIKAVGLLKKVKKIEQDYTRDYKKMTKGLGV